MMAIIKWGLWQRRWFIFWWSLAIFAFIFLNLVFYPSFRDQAQQFNETLSRLPDTARSFFSDTGDFFSPVGYLSSQVFYLMFPMLIGILGITLGSSLIGREERDGTLELLLSRSISRTRLFVSKVVVGLIITGLVGFVGLATTAIMCRLVGLNVSSPRVIIASLVALLLGLTWTAVALMITTLGRGVRLASIGLATFIALGGYILVSLQRAASWLRWPAKFFPFYYYRPGDILNGHFVWRNVILLLAGIIICLAVSLLAFNKRDIGN